MLWKGWFDQGPYKYASYDYICEKQGDTWVFMNFVLPRIYCVDNGIER